MTVYGQQARQQDPGQPPPVEPDELRTDIAQARAELGETLQALAARANVPARARASAAHAVRRAQTAWITPVPWLVLSASLSAAALVVVLVRSRPAPRPGRRR